MSLENVIEISSPSTAKQDRIVKFNKYEQAGVKEYWIVEPDGKYINVFTLQKLSVFQDLFVDLAPVFSGI